jgi:hypothetical protein
VRPVPEPVVTEFRYRLHPVGPTVLAGPILYPAARAPEVLACYRDLAEHAPDELGSVITLHHVPPLPLFPADLHGKPVVSLVVCLAGDPAAGQRVLAPLRQNVPPLLDLVAPAPYLVHQGTFDATVPHGLRYYWKSEYLTALTDEATAVLLDHAWNSGSPCSYTIIFHLGGAVARTDPATAAFTGRHAGYAVNINAEATDVDDYAAQRAWARHFWGPCGRTRPASTSTSSATRARIPSAPPTASRPTVGWPR